MATYAEASTTVTEATSTGGASLACGGGHSIVIDDAKWGEMRKQELFPPELVRCSDVSGDIHQKALCAMSTHLSSLVDYNTLVPQMRGRGLISEDAEWILSSPNTKPSEKVQALLQSLRGPGKLVAERLYLCILDTHESCNDHSESHYDFAMMLKRQLLSVLKISTERQMDHEAQQTCIGHALKMIPDTPLDTKIALQLMENLGVNGDGVDMCIRRQALSVSAICECWHTQKSSATIGGLTQALLSCRGLGKIVSGFFPLYLSNPPAVRRLISRLGKHWTELAVYLGYTDAEISSITCKRGVPAAQQIQMFLRVFRMPDLGEETEYILQDALKLAGLQSCLVNSPNTIQTKETPVVCNVNVMYNNCSFSGRQRRAGMCQLPRYSKSKMSWAYPAIQSRPNWSIIQPTVSNWFSTDTETDTETDSGSVAVLEESEEVDESEDADSLKEELYSEHLHQYLRAKEADKQSPRQQCKRKVNFPNSEQVEEEHSMSTKQETLEAPKMKNSWGTLSSKKDVHLYQQQGIVEPPVIQKPPQERFHTGGHDQLSFLSQLENKLPTTSHIHEEESPVEEKKHKQNPLKQQEELLLSQTMQYKMQKEELTNSQFKEGDLILNNMVFKTAYYKQKLSKERYLKKTLKELAIEVVGFSAVHSSTSQQQLQQLQQQHRRLQNEVSILTEMVQSLVQSQGSSQDCMSSSCQSSIPLQVPKNHNSNTRGRPSRIPVRTRPQFTSVLTQAALGLASPHSNPIQVPRNSHSNSRRDLPSRIPAPSVNTCSQATLGLTSPHSRPVRDASENSIRRLRSQNMNGNGSHKYGLYLYSPTNQILPRQLCVVIIAMCASPEHGTPMQSAVQLKQKMGKEYRHHHFQMKEYWPVKFVDEKAEFNTDLVLHAGFEVESMGLTEITQEEVDLRGENDTPAYLIYHVSHNQDNAMQQFIKICFRVVGLDRPDTLKPVLIIGSSDIPPAPHRSLLQQQMTVTDMIVQHLHRKWYSLGIKLGLRSRSLTRIQRESTSDIHRCRSVIKVWMNSTSVIPSDTNIGVLVDAVRNVDEAFAEILDQHLRDTST